MEAVERWIDELGYDSLPGALLRREEPPSADHRFAPEIRAMFEGGAGASAAAVLCIDRVPTVALVDATELRSDSGERRAQVRILCERLWNQNLARLVLVAAQDELQAWSVDDPKKGGERVARSMSDPAAQIWSLSGLASGRVLQKRGDWFNPDKRVDSVLLDNIKEMMHPVKGLGLDLPTARELIARTIFVAYLEDRKVVTDSYREERGVGRILDLLTAQNSSGLDKLYLQLREDFNGDFLKPSRQDGRAWADMPSHSYVMLADFLRRTVLRSGQRDFWRFDFSQIPIELIAGIYETFLASKVESLDERFNDQADTSLRKITANVKRRKGAYYTPRMLAETVVDIALDGLSDIFEARIFDGACGSGMLLTTAYRRLIRAKQADADRNGESLPGFKERSKILTSQIFGSDIDEDACRLTAFSLYLALLSDLTPSDLALLNKGGHKLPDLEENIRRGAKDGDFFSSKGEKARKGRFTIFLSNPPWRKLKPGEPELASMQAWRERQEKPLPTIPLNEVAAAFALGAADALESGGRVALILPINLFVSGSTTQRAFRADLLGRFRVEKIINFSDMRELAFADARHPFVVLIATTRGQKNRYEKVEGESFEYWTPKTDIAIAFGRLSIHGADRAELAASALLDEEPHLGLRFWGSDADMVLLRRLWRRGRIRDLERAGWLLSKGFHSEDNDLRRPPDKRSVVAPPSMVQSLFLRPVAIRRNVPIVLRDWLIKFPFSHIARETDRRKFTGSRVVWPDGAHAEHGIRAVFSDLPFTFQHSIGVLSAPEGEEGRLLARFIACYMRSPLGSWLLLLLSSSVASERPKITAQEISGWPFCRPQDHVQPSEAWEIVRSVDMLLADVEKDADPAACYDKVKSKIDRLVFDYFALSVEERASVEELASYAGSSLQPTSLSHQALAKPLRLPPSVGALHRYCNRFVVVFHRWRDATGGSGSLTAVPWTAAHAPIGAVVLELGNGRSTSAPVTERVNDDEILPIIVETLGRKSIQGDIQDLLSIPNLTIVDGTRIYIVKPLVTRFWLQRAAIEDASRLASEILAVQAASAADEHH